MLTVTGTRIALGVAVFLGYRHTRSVKRRFFSRSGGGGFTAV